MLARSAMDARPHPVVGASSSSSSSSSNSWLLATATSSDTRIVLSLLPNPPCVHSLCWTTRAHTRPDPDPLLLLLLLAPTSSSSSLPEHLAPNLSPDSPLTPDDKRTLFTSVYLRACSAGNADTLEWLLSLPPDPALSSTENAAAARRFSLTAASLANADDSVFLGSPRAQGKRPQQEPPVVVPDTAPRRWIDLEAADDEGNTALGTCVALGHAEAVRVLVENGAKVNQADRGASALSLFSARRR